MTFNKFVFFYMTEYDVLKGRITVYHIFWKIHYGSTEFSGINMTFIVLKI